MKMSKRKILLIEDELYISDLYREAFEEKGYQVDVAQDGEEGLKKANSSIYEFVILDLMLSKLSGLEVLKKMKNKVKSPVYILTNIDEIKTLNLTLADGAAGCFVKVNYTPDQLVGAIERRQAQIKKPPKRFLKTRLIRVNDKN